MRKVGRVWKFEFPITDSFRLSLPVDGVIILVAMQGHIPCMWVRFSEYGLVERKFELRGAGHDVAGDLFHRGSFLADGGVFVWHLFENVS